MKTINNTSIIYNAKNIETVKNNGIICLYQKQY